MSAHRTLIRGGHVVTVDPDIGTIPRGEVLVEDEVIVAVGADLGVTDAQIVDATDRIVAPGNVDTHRHTWQSQLRGYCSDLSLSQYIFGFWADATPSYDPDDVRLGNLAGALDAVNSGVTSVLDFSHITNTPAHADAAVEGLRAAGIRAVYAYGLGQSNPMAPPDHDRMKDFARVADEHFSADGLLTLGAALTEIGLTPMSTTAAQKRMADERGAISTAHIGANWSLPTAVTELDAAGVLDSRLVLAHANTFTDADWEICAARGVKVSTSPESELNMGMGRLAIPKVRAHGLRPTVAVDVVSLSGGDVFSQARQALGFVRWTDAEAYTLAGTDIPALATSAHDALEWATINGADALGLGDRTGSLTPGKQADVLIVGGDALGARPVNDPVGQLILQTTAAHVESVMVAGRFLKRDGALVGVDVARLAKELEGSRERIIGRMADLAASKTPPPPEVLAGFPAWVSMNLAS